jgi:hypothetical protein
MAFSSMFWQRPPAPLSPGNELGASIFKRQYYSSLNLFPAIFVKVSFGGCPFGHGANF